jgi:hypothetical protein
MQDGIDGAFRKVELSTALIPQSLDDQIAVGCSGVERLQQEQIGVPFEQLGSHTSAL